jgi:hypothetical protein
LWKAGDGGAGGQGEIDEATLTERWNRFGGGDVVDKWSLGS